MCCAVCFYKTDYLNRLNAKKFKIRNTQLAPVVYTMCLQEQQL